MKFDVDIDVQSGLDKKLYGVQGNIYNPEKDDLVKHPSAFYIETNMPIDPVTDRAAIDYKSAEKKGFVKIDLLTNTAYNNFLSKTEVLEAFAKDPDWNLLKDREFVYSLPQLGNWVKFVKEMNPTNINELADILALIRPGKQYLIAEYKKNKEKARKRLWKPEEDGIYFKKSHAYAYAGLIICLMNKRKKKNILKF